MAATTLLQCHASSSSSSSSSCSCALRPSLNLNKKPFLFPSSKRLFLVNSPLVFSHSLSIHSHRQSHSHGHSYHSFANSPCRASVSQTSETELPLCRKPPSETLVVVAGATGYIGRYVARELVNRGYNVATLARPRSGIGGKNGPEDTLRQMEGTTVCFGEVTDIDSLSSAMSSLNGPVDVVVSCLASRTGGIKDSWRIDYQATLNCLTAGRNAGAKHFVLLSAICVQKPLLEFQKAKLKFEDELKKLADEASITYSIVRPTAFFKSLAGQVETVKNGNPYVMFGDGTLCACKPISEEDLASFIADCIHDEDKINKILPIGGPGKALTPKEQAEMLFEILGKEPKFLKAPVAFMDFVISILDFLKKFFPSLEDAAEFGRIGKYYATESMLVYDPETDTYDADATPSYGKDTLEEFFKRVVKEGLAGQELGDQAVFRSS